MSDDAIRDFGREELAELSDPHVRSRTAFVFALRDLELAVGAAATGDRNASRRKILAALRGVETVRADIREIAARILESR